MNEFFLAPPRTPQEEINRLKMALEWLGKELEKAVRLSPGHYASQHELPLPACEKASWSAAAIAAVSMPFNRHPCPCRLCGEPPQVNGSGPFFFACQNPDCEKTQGPEGNSVEQALSRWNDLPTTPQPNDIIRVQYRKGRLFFTKRKPCVQDRYAPRVLLSEGKYKAKIKKIFSTFLVVEILEAI